MIRFTNQRCSLKSAEVDVQITVEVLAAWLLADFITGLFHWFEDRYLGDDQSLEFFQGMAQDNLRHHRYPTALCMVSWWENMRSAVVFAWPVGVIFAACGAPLWVWLGICFTGFGNLVHRFSHEPKRKLGRFVKFLQWSGLFISHEHHARHHYYDSGDRVDPKWNASRTYCPMTNWVNPVLDALGFWFFAESVMRIFGIRPIDERNISIRR